MSAILEAREITYIHRGAPRPALDRLDLTIERGELLVLAGGSGAGKTTLARCLSGALPILSGSILHPQGAVKTGFLPQQATASLNPRLTVREAVTEPLAIAGANRDLRDERFAELRLLLGLDEALAGRLSRQVSGGQARLVALARAMAIQPTLLILDEPLAGLDLPLQLSLLELFRKLVDEDGVSALLISHDIVAAGRFADRIAVMSDRRIAECGAAPRVLEAPEHPVTKELLKAVPGQRNQLFVHGEA